MASIAMAQVHPCNKIPQRLKPEFFCSFRHGGNRDLTNLNGVNPISTAIAEVHSRNTILCGPLPVTYRVPGPYPF